MRRRRGPDSSLIVALALLCETVLAHTSRARVAMLGDEGAAGARRLGELLARRQTNLAVIVVIRHAAQIGGVLLVLAHAERYSPEPLAWAGDRRRDDRRRVGSLEAVAKTVALRAHRRRRLPRRHDRTGRHPDPAAPVPGRTPRPAPPPSAPGILPTTTTSPPVSDEELLAFAEVAHESEAIEEEEQALIGSIIEFGDTIVREVMVPRLDMVTVEADLAGRAT